MDRLEVSIPQGFREEKEYLLKFIFSDYLGLCYDVKESNSNDYIIRWEQKTIVFHDVFFTKLDRKGGYDSSLLPKVIFTINKFLVESDIPVIYGDDSLIIKQDSIDCGIDIFSSIFFMLTRWEEKVSVDAMDVHSRFLGGHSIAYQYNFLHRPIVNEYLEMLWSMMQSLGFNGPRKERLFKLVPTHDIDRLMADKSVLRNVKYIVQSLVSKQFDSAWFFTRHLFTNPFDLYDFFMDCSEKAQIKSHFYFMSSTFSTEDSDGSGYLSSKYLKEIIKKIDGRNHLIGFHPSYFTYNNNLRWRKERQQLEEATKVPIKEGRQHYLRIQLPETLNIWELNQMSYDSSLCYADVEGFRCGTGDMFHYFDFVNHKELSLIEMPLIVMEGTLLNYRQLTFERMADTLNAYKNICKKYKMPYTFLFHNTSFVGPGALKLRKIYKSLLFSN